MLHVPPQQVGRLVVAQSFDVARNLVGQIGRCGLDFSKKIGGGLVETLNVKLEFLGDVLNCLVNGDAARVDEHGDYAVDIAGFLDTEAAR